MSIVDMTENFDTRLTIVWLPIKERKVISERKKIVTTNEGP